MHIKSVFASAALVFTTALYGFANPAIVPFFGDAQTRIRADRVYTHALDFGGRWNNPVVNEVQFRSTGVDGSNDAHSWGEFPETAHAFEDNSPRISSPTDSGIYQVLGDFSYNLNNKTPWINGLTPGVVYEARFYHRPFGDPADAGKSRWQTFTFKPDTGVEDAILFNPDGQQEDQMLVYRYTAGGSGKLEIHFLTSALNPSDSYHCYGLVNEQVFEIAPDAVSDLTAVSARLNAQTIVGGEAAFAAAFWQAADAGDWAGAESAEFASMVAADGSIYFDVGGLAPNTEYRFRFSLTNDAPRVSWSEERTFTTLPNAPLFTVAPAQVTGTNATLRGELLYFGPDAAAATVTLLWGADAETLDEAPLARQNAPLGEFVFDVAGLGFGETYYYNFMVENDLNAQSSLDAPRSFTTLAAPVWGAIAAESAHLALALSASFAAPGAAAADVTCWLGETPETMRPAMAWTDSGAMEFAHTESGLQPGAVYHYAFHALCEPDASTSWSVWSATNMAQVAHVHEPLPALASGYYNVLMHLGAKLADDAIKLPSRDESDISADRLAAFGGQAAQAPYPGLVYDGLPVIASASPSLAWTVLTNNNNVANNIRWNMNRDDYVKYFHIYIISPDATNRPVRIHYTSDDRLHIWRNGESVLTGGYTGDGNENSGTTFALHPGVNSLAIKFIELGGSDYFGFRLTTLGNLPIDDLRYSFTASVLGVPPAPKLLALTHESAAIDPNFAYAHSGDVFDLYVARDTQDRGAAFADWENSPTCAVQAFRGISAPPASVEFALEPATRYTARVFTAKAGFWERSLPLEFRAYNYGADIVSLAPTANTGTSIIANASLDYCGAGLDTADVYLYWWSDADPATTNSAALPEQYAGAVAIPIDGLWYSQDYHCQFAASNALGFAWSPGPVAFRTVGIPVFGDVAHATPQPNEIQMSAEILSPGPEGGEVTCWFGADSEALASIGAETFDAPGDAVFSRSGLVVGGTYYYAFQIQSSAGSGAQEISWDVWTATNKVVLSGATIWTAGGAADTRWQNPANWSHGIPGAGATAVFPALANGGAYAVSADADIDIATVNILSGDTDSVTFSLGARALNAAAFNIGFDRVRGRFILASGEINVSGAFAAGHNASWCHATIAAGSRLNAQTLKAGWRSQNTDATDDNTLVIEPGAEVVVNGETHVSYSEAGESSPNRSHLTVRGRLDTAGILIGKSTGWNSTSGFMDIDGGAVTNRGSTMLGSWAGSNRALTLTNRARFIQTAGQLDLGIRGSNERLLVLDGSVFELAGNAYLMRGSDHSGNNSGIIVSNAIFKATGSLGIGRNGAGGGNDNLFLIYEDPGHETRVQFGGDLHMNSTSSRNQIGLHGGVLDLPGRAFNTALGGTADGGVVAGINNRIHITRPTRVTAETLAIRTDTRLIFDLQENADYAFPIFDIAAAATFSAAATVEINLGKFTGTATLLQSATGDFNPAYVVEINQSPGFNYKLTAKANLLKIHASPSATLIIVK